MSLDARNAPKSGGAPRTLIPAEAHYARLVQIIDLGLQARSFQGESKTPCQAVNLTFEFPYQRIEIEENGQKVSKPRWLSMDVNVVEGDRAKFPLIMAAFGNDPIMTNWLGRAVNIQVVHKPGTGEYVGRTFERISSVTALPNGADAQVPALENPTKIFNFDAPDATVFNGLPEFMQNKIRNALNFDKIAAFLPDTTADASPAAAAAQAPVATTPAAPTLPVATAPTPPAPMGQPAPVPAPAVPAPQPAASAPVVPTVPQTAAPQPQPQPVAQPVAQPAPAPAVAPPVLNTDNTPF